MKKPQNCVMVIFGASGDLTKRKLMPSLYNLYKRDLLPDSFAVLGIGRTEYTDDTFRKEIKESVEKFGQNNPFDSNDERQFLRGLYYISINTKNPDGYARVKTKLEEIDREHNTRGNYLYYMSTPPSIFTAITSGLGAHDMNFQGDGKGWRRLIVEKPFGYDLESARELNQNIQKVFDEKQIYRIDHYLGKETVQNLLVLRFANGVYEPLWNRNYIDHVDVTAAENIGVGDRGGYYEGAGALRDMFQNHLLNVVGMIAMEPPSSFQPTSVRNETIKVFESLRPINPEELEEHVVRGQYIESTIDGKKVRGYRDAKNVDPNSKTETYVAVKFFVDNWRWGGVPFYVRTGKHLPTRVTEVVINFRQTPHQLFGKPSQECYECNKMIIRIQPDEGISMRFNMKLPGSGFDIKNVDMDFHYTDLADVYVPEAYERLLLDSMLGDNTLFARADAVEECWRFVDPILKTWERNPDIKLYGYPAGSWGPPEALDLFEAPQQDWTYPCKSLTDEDTYCEL